MRNLKTLLIAILLTLTLLIATTYAIQMPRYAETLGWPAIHVFSPTEIVTISSAGDVAVSKDTVVSFDAEVTIYLNQNTTKTYLWPANRPLGIVSGVTTIHVSAAVNMAVMQ